jgi:hypothetical protein
MTASIETLQKLVVGLIDTTEKNSERVDNIGVESTEWRKKNDEENLQFRTFVADSIVALDSKITALKVTTDSHTLDINYVNDLKEKASWSWNTAKFLTGFSIGAFGLIQVIYHGFIFLKEYFKHS